MPNVLHCNNVKYFGLLLFILDITIGSCSIAAIVDYIYSDDLQYLYTCT